MGEIDRPCRVLLVGKADTGKKTLANTFAQQFQSTCLPTTQRGVFFGEGVGPYVEDLTARINRGEMDVVWYCEEAQSNRLEGTVGEASFTLLTARHVPFIIVLTKADCMLDDRFHLRQMEAFLRQLRNKYSMLKGHVYVSTAVGEDGRPIHLGGLVDLCALTIAHASEGTANAHERAEATTRIHRSAQIIVKAVLPVGGVSLIPIPGVGEAAALSVFWRAFKRVFRLWDVSPEVQKLIFDKALRKDVMSGLSTVAVVKGAVWLTTALVAPYLIPLAAIPDAIVATRQVLYLSLKLMCVLVLYTARRGDDGTGDEAAQMDQAVEVYEARWAQELEAFCQQQTVISLLCRAVNDRQGLERLIEDFLARMA